MSNVSADSRSAAEQEQAFLDGIEDMTELMDKSAADMTDTSDFIQVEASRFEEKLPEPVEPSKEEKDKPPLDKKWSRSPSVRNQMQQHPQTVRYANPETKILNLSKSEELKEWNRIQQGCASIEAPSLAITEVEKQQHDGSWTVYVTYSEVHYMEL